ncbi:hypothetical protein TcYC6_0023450 [Trypanosoma cruzi]|nr:hypothetical protein TcYC6_0023450 [Trypanosoma cruzi]
MDRTPPDMVILGLQKIAARLERKQARPLKKEWADGYIRSRTDWKQRVVFRPAWITASCRSEIAGLNSQQFHAGAGREPNFGLVSGVKDGESGSPPSFVVRQDTRAGRVRHYNVMQDTSRKRRLTNLTTAHVERSSGSLECHGALHKTGCVEARSSNRGDMQFDSTRDLAVGDAR